MKKILSFAAAVALLFGAASCDRVEEGTGIPQSNPQEEIFKTSDITVAPATGVANLEDAQVQDNGAVLANVATKYWPKAYALKMVGQMANNEAMNDATEFDTKCVQQEDGNWVVYASANALNEAYRETVSKDPAQGSAYIRLTPYGTSADGKANVRLGGPDFYYGPYQYEIKPMAPSHVIDNVYYLVLSENADLTSPIAKVEMRNGGGSPYDDPNFETVYDNNAGQTLYWGITNAAGDPVYGVAEDEVDAGEGTLVASASHYNKFSYVANVKVSVNMEKLTWKAFAAIEKFYLPTGRRYQHKDAQCVYTDNFRFYQGVANLNKDFMFDPTAQWNDHNELGLAPDTEVKETVNGDGETTYSGELAVGDIYIPAAYTGLNYVTLDYTAMTFTVLPVKTIGVIGGFNGWGGDAVMTPSSNNLVWTSDVLDMSAGDEFKFRFNGAWNVDMGGSLDNLQFKGGNLSVAEAGKYIVTLDFTTYPYVAKLAKQ